MRDVLRMPRIINWTLKVVGIVLVAAALVYVGKVRAQTVQGPSARPKPIETSKLVTVDTKIAEGVSPLRFMGDDSRELFVCTKIEHVKGKEWDIRAARDCKLDEGVTLDDVANGIIEMNRERFKQP